MASHSFRCVITIDTSCPRHEPKLQKDGDDDAWSIVSGPTERAEVSRAMINWKRVSNDLHGYVDCERIGLTWDTTYSNIPL